ncbi:hypothetical protein ACH4GP_01035 [Streptomyces celluloflavus]|uniref:Uncharacterized protein n=1 Tax=Streptomyces celluloflavus TaxID=58344 RepID=A0ABW7R4L8_9ACTN
MPEFEFNVTVKNVSGKSRKFCMYQTYPSAKLQSLAWFTKTVHDKSGLRTLDSADFRWNEVFSFVWAETGKLNEQVHFDAHGEWPADPAAKKTSSTKTTGGNQIFFTKEDAAYTFDSMQKPTDEATNTLTIHTGNPVDDNQASIGLGMYGSPVFAAQAEANQHYRFQLKPTYWLVASTAQEGDAVSLNVESDPLKLDFSKSSHATVTFDSKNKLTQVPN